MDPFELAATSEQNHTQQDASELRVIRQLVEALLFEGLVTYQHIDEYFYFSLGNSDYRASGSVGGFGRIRLEQSAIYRIVDDQLVAVELEKLVDELPAASKVKAQLSTELQQTISFCRWNEKNITKADCRRALSYLDLESAIDEGHPYHPCFKARTGFDFDDHAAYGPESANLFQLHWLAIERRFISANLNQPSESHFWQGELGEESWQLLAKAYQAQGISFEEYALLPIHPWQRKAMDSALTHPVKQRHIVDLGVAGDWYQASISVRTLINVSQPDKAHIKLPLNMVNTSSLRTVEAHSVTTAPVLSNWLQTLIEGDDWYQQKQVMAIQAEYAGIALTNPDDSDTANAWVNVLADSLNVIFRDSQPLQNKQSTCVPFVALALVEQDGKPFIEHWIKKYGCEAWVQRLLDVAIIPVWHLLVKHGIAVEAHGQNMSLCLSEGWPQKVILRDFHESLEYVENYLAAPQHQPDFSKLNQIYDGAPDDKYYWMSNLDALRELLVDTLFVYNLADLADLLERYYRYEESHFWHQVNTALAQYQQQAQGWLARLEQIDLYQAQIQTESLLSKKLSGQKEREFHHQISNPLKQG